MEITQQILKQVTEAKFFSVLFDETTDMSHTSQLSLSLRYVYEDRVHENFIGFLDPHDANFKKKVDLEENEEVEEIDTISTAVEPKLSGEVLGKTVLSMLTGHSLDIKFCMGVGTDGCSVMVSKQHGAVAEIQKVAVNAVRSPCFNHALNLSISKSSDVPLIRNCVGVIKEVCLFFNQSAKRNFVLKKHLKGQLVGLCETRWVERHDSVLIFKNEVSLLLEALEEISGWDDTISSTKAKSFVRNIADFEFIMAISTLSSILAVSKPLSLHLKKKSLDVESAAESLKDLVQCLEEARVS
jgi:hypothetical protein